MTTETPNLKPLRPRPTLTTAPEEPSQVLYAIQEAKAQKLTFSDGLNFGCGFWVAGTVFFGAAGFFLFLLGVFSRL